MNGEVRADSSIGGETRDNASVALFSYPRWCKFQIHIPLSWLPYAKTHPELTDAPRGISSFFGRFVL